MGDWYEDRIESGVKDVVRLLRDNGFNTNSSCHHSMEVECLFSLDGELQRLNTLLFAHFKSRGEPTSYVISVNHRICDGHHFGTSLRVLLGREKVKR